MYYSLCVATDFRGYKVNLQFFFDSHGPQLAQILSRATEAFNQYFRSRGLVEQPFSITTAVIFNERNETWDRLERSAQLVHNGQIYLFQPDVNDIPAEIPDPISATPFLTDYVSPQRSFINQSTASNGGGYVRSSSPGAQIPSAYDPYYRQRYHDASPAYQPSYGGTYSSYANGSPDPSSRRVGSSYQTYAYTSESAYRGSSQSRAVPMSADALHGDPQYQELMAKAAAIRAASVPKGDISGPSIFAEERRHEQDLSRLTLDQYREVVRSEAREFTPSPSRERTV